jgi:hypothetical protein
MANPDGLLRCTILALTVPRPALKVSPRYGIQPVDNPFLEDPMVENTTSQSQQKEGQKAAFERAMEENIERIESMFGDVQKLEKQSVEQAHQAIDESAKMMKEMLGYSVRLHEQWTKIALESSRRTAQLFVPSWMS